MKALLTQSMMFALVGIPILAAREQSAAKGLKKALLMYVAFGVFYTFALRFVYPYLS